MTTLQTEREPVRRARLGASGPGRRSLAVWIVGLVAVLAAGCTSYSKALEKAKTDVAEGNSNSAIKRLNNVIGLKERYQIPEKLDGKNTLLLLERATLFQSLGEYELAARDMMLADQQFDYLDIGAAGKAKIGKYIYSGKSVRYRAPAYERLLLNTINMINFLALRDWEGAKVEARRFSILEHFYTDKKGEFLLPGAIAFGNYLGAMAFEAAGDYEEAAKRYVKAWYHELREDGLRERLVTLCNMIGYKPSELVDVESGELSEIDSAVAGGEAPSFESYREQFVDGEVLVLIQTGLVPYKEAKRYSIWNALDYAEGEEVAAGAAAGAVMLSNTEQERAEELAVSGALKFVNFPALTDKGLPPARDVGLKWGGETKSVRSGVDVERQVEHGWKLASIPLMGAAISRMIVRAAAGAGTREAVQHGASQSDDARVRGASQGLGMLAQIFVEGGMAAADEPDTRSWSLLPARIRYRRFDASPGQHEVEVSINGHDDSKSVEVPDTGPTVVNFSRYR